MIAKGVTNVEAIGVPVGFAIGNEQRLLAGDEVLARLRAMVPALGALRCLSPDGTQDFHIPTGKDTDGYADFVLKNGVLSADIVVLPSPSQTDVPEQLAADDVRVIAFLYDWPHTEPEKVRVGVFVRTAAPRPSTPERIGINVTSELRTL